MGRRNDLNIDHISVLRAILKRGHLYNGPKQLGLNIFSSSTPGGNVKSSAQTGLRFIKSIFNFIDENGGVSNIKSAPEYEKEFLREIKKSFKSFQDIQTTVQEFLEREES